MFRHQIAIEPADIDHMGHVNNAVYLKWVQEAVVVAEVIAEKVQGARAFFRTVLKRGEDVLSEIESCWCCLDAATQRPARLARDVIGRFLPPSA